MRKALLSVIAIIILLCFVHIDAEAQCSMCRAVAESSHAGGSDVGKGLNNGIIYMMGIPYIILMVLGYLFFRKPLKEKWGSRVS